MAVLDDHPLGHVPTVMTRCSGSVSGADRNHAEAVVTAALVAGPATVTLVSIDLCSVSDPAWPRPALARVVVRYDGHLVRIHADAATMPDAIDVLAGKLRSRLRSLLI